MRMPDPIEALIATLTDEEKVKALEHFFSLNPRWRGAHLNDVLEEMRNGDANLYVIEPMLDQHRDQIGDVGLFCVACDVATQLYGHDPSWGHVKALMDRVR